MSRLRRGGGVLALGLAIVLLLAWATNACRPAAGPSILLITIDTLRADHLPLYGYKRDTTPHIDQVAANGLVFDQVYAAIPETGPSFASMLTGRWPAQLGMRGNGRPLAEDVPTLATQLSAAGYRTAAFVSGFPLSARLSGLQRGFDLYDDNFPDPRGSTQRVQRLAPGTTDAALAWLENLGTGPFFLWVHYYDVHGDYAPGPPYETLFRDGPAGPQLPLQMIPAYQRLGNETDAAAYISRYDGEIRKVDDQIGRLLQHLRGHRLEKSTILAITADHGESLTEHGYFMDHGNELYQPSLRVPLILSGPGLPDDGRRLPQLARLPDLFPTLLDLTGQPHPQGVPAASLMPWLITGGTGTMPREALSEARFQPYRALTPGADVGPKLSARDDRYTFVLRLDGPGEELYDRLHDPGESRNLLLDPERRESLAGLGRQLGQRLRQRLNDGGGADPVVFTQEVRTRLDAGGPR